jgi:hypothetical protein
MTTLARVWCLTWGFAFIGIAAMFHNPVESDIWSSWFLIASVLCFGVLWGRVPMFAYAGMTMICMGWGIFQWPPVFSGFGNPQNAGPMERMATESVALILTAIVIGVCGYMNRAKELAKKE